MQPRGGRVSRRPLKYRRAKGGLLALLVLTYGLTFTSVSLSCGRRRSPSPPRSPPSPRPCAALPPCTWPGRPQSLGPHDALFVAAAGPAAPHPLADVGPRLRDLHGPAGRRGERRPGPGRL